MRLRTYAAHRELAKHERSSGSASPPIKCSPVDALRLPVRCEATTRYVKNLPVHSPLGSLALVLYEAGFLSEADATEALPDLVAKGLQRVHERDLGTLQFLDSFDLGLAPSISALDGCLDGDRASSDSYAIGVELVNSFERCVVGHRLVELEAQFPGLGEVALYAAELAAARTLGCWSPSSVREIASYLWWRGAQTQEEWVEELLVEGEDPDDCGCSPDHFDKMFEHAWVCNPRRSLDAFGLLQAIDAEAQDVAAVASLVADILCEIDSGVSFPDASETERESVYRGCMLRWNSNDPMDEVLDDHINYANQGCDCFTTFIAIWTVDASLSGFASWLTEYRRGLRLCKKLDQLLQLIGEREVNDDTHSL